MKGKTGFLVLDDGTYFRGIGFGYQLPKADELGALSADENRGAGEVVFNTGMCGYHEILTDPSYTGQIITFTYPLIGNYGTDDQWSETLERSVDPEHKVKAAGMVVRSLYDGPVPEGRKSLDLYLKENRISGLSEVDTRALTIRIRNFGMPKGVLVAPEEDGALKLTEEEFSKIKSYLNAYPEMTGRNLVSGQDVKTPEIFNPEGTPHLALIDCGIKENILTLLQEKGCKVTVFPHATLSGEIEKVKPDGVFYSNGPGDPAVLSQVIQSASELIGKLPLMGICLGHQILGLALGANTLKMKFGHHGVNNPVRDEITGRVYVTSQNHGFMVDRESLPKGVDTWFLNANDETVEGILSEELKIASVQFHPESAPGPEDTFWIFDSFIDLAASGGIISIKPGV